MKLFDILVLFIISFFSMCSNPSIVNKSISTPNNYHNWGTTATVKISTVPKHKSELRDSAWIAGMEQYINAAYDRYSTSIKNNIMHRHFVKAKFIGTWSETNDTESCNNSLEFVEIGTDTSNFSVIFNQYCVVCKNVYHSDTLYLYTLDSDVGLGFQGPEYHPPIYKSLLAKCYIKDSSLRIIYVEKALKYNIKNFELVTVFPYKLLYLESCN